MEQVAVLVEATTVVPEEIQMFIDKAKSIDANNGEDEILDAKKKFEKNYIIEALNKSEWCISKTAEMLGIDRSTLSRKMRKYGIKKVN